MCRERWQEPRFYKCRERDRRLNRRRLDCRRGGWSARGRARDRIEEAAEVGYLIFGSGKRCGHDFGLGGGEGDALLALAAVADRGSGVVDSPAIKTIHSSETRRAPAGQAICCRCVACFRPSEHIVISAAQHCHSNSTFCLQAHRHSLCLRARLQRWRRRKRERINASRTASPRRHLRSTGRAMNTQHKNTAATSQRAWSSSSKTDISIGHPKSCG